MINRLVFLLLNVVIIFSANAVSKDNILQLIEEQVKSANAGDLNLGIYIENLDTGKEKFSLHANRFFIPASVTKVFTVYAALKHLGAEYQIPTTFYADKSSIKNNQLHANLYMKFYGDPTLTYLQLVDSFKALGIKAIYGNVIIDDSFLDDKTTSPGGFTWDDNPFYYAAPKSAVIIDKNTAEAWMKPSDNAGETAQLRIDRPYVLNILNKVETVKPRSQECPYKSKYIGNNTYEVYGCMFNNSSKEIRLNFALQDTKLMAKKYIKQALKESGIALYGNIENGHIPNVKLVYKHLSMPLKDFLIPILSGSCNITSAALFKHMAALSAGRPGSDEDGKILLQNMLEKIGISKDSVSLYDGSGESRYNLVTPKAVVELLKAAYNNQKIRSNFVGALPQYGGNGTLKSRSISDNYGQFIYAKTGTFKGVSALAGYYLPPNGSKYAFAIISNNSKLSWDEAKSLEDKILYILLSK